MKFCFKDIKRYINVKNQQVKYNILSKKWMSFSRDLLRLGTPNVITAHAIIPIILRSVKVVLPAYENIIL